MVPARRTMARWLDRAHAGSDLAQLLRGATPATVVAVPRSGVPVARAVADQLHCDLELAPLLDSCAPTVIVVDDFALTGATLAGAVRALPNDPTATVIAAVPVATVVALDRLRALVDRVVCVDVGDDAAEIAEFFADLREVTDDEVRRLTSPWRSDIDTATPGYRKMLLRRR